MWVTRGGPPGKPSVLFEYDPSRGGKVPVRLLDDFQGILQALRLFRLWAGCAARRLTRIGVGITLDVSSWKRPEPRRPRQTL